MTAGRLSTQGYRIIQPQPQHGTGVYETICRANGYTPERGVPGVFGLTGWDTLLDRFGEGQFVAVSETGEVIGVALALRTHYPPSAPPKSWHEVIGDLSLTRHEPGGAWLYGVEKAVHPDHQGKGVGTALYKAQFGLAQRQNLKGIYAGGMLKGYKAHKGSMSVREYAGRVMRGEVFDPTVSVQMKRGFKAQGVIENYAWDSDAEHTGMLIVWETPLVWETPCRSERPARPRAAGAPARV